MANLSKASNVVQERYILYDVTGFTQKWHSIPVATNCKWGVPYDRLAGGFGNRPRAKFEHVQPAPAAAAIGDGHGFPWHIQAHAG